MRKNEPEDMGGCEAEQPAGWYCTRDFHHNGPCATKRLPAAPSVEQDELLLAAKEVLANGHQHDVGGGDVFVGTCEAAERLQRAVDARAASTPANVAQRDAALATGASKPAPSCAALVASVLPLIQAMEARERAGTLPENLQKAWDGFAIDGHRCEPAAPSVEQDECGAFEAWCQSEGISPDKSVQTGVYSHPSARVAWRGWQARAASTSANVEQGAEAVAYGEFNKARERFLSGEPVAMSDSTRELARQVLEQQASDTRSDEEKILASVNFICDTRLDDPPAQTALTDAEMAACAIQACYARTANDGWIFDNTDQLRAFLTAVQSAIGEKNEKD